MPKRYNANLFEVLIGQVTQNSKINIVLGKALNVLGHTELLEPVRNLLHCSAPSRVSFSIGRMVCSSCSANDYSRFQTGARPSRGSGRSFRGFTVASDHFPDRSP